MHHFTANEPVCLAIIVVVIITTLYSINSDVVFQAEGKLTKHDKDDIKDFYW